MVKRAADQIVLTGTAISNAELMFQELKTLKSQIVLYLIANTCIDKFKSDEIVTLKPVPVTMTLHRF